MNRLAMAALVSLARTQRIRAIHSVLGGTKDLATDHSPQLLRDGSRPGGAVATSLLGRASVANAGPAGCPSPADISSFDPRQVLENEEFPGWGGPRYYEPALKISRYDGDRDLVLRYASPRISGNSVDIELKDVRDDIRVTLHYHVYAEYDVQRRSATIANRTSSALTIKSAGPIASYIGCPTVTGRRYNLAVNNGQTATQGVFTWLKITVWGRIHSSPGVKCWECPVRRLWPASQPVLFRILRKDGLVSPVSSPIGLLRDHMRTGS